MAIPRVELSDLSAIASRKTETDTASNPLRVAFDALQEQDAPGALLWECPVPECSRSCDSRRAIQKHFHAVHTKSFLQCSRAGCEAKFRLRSDLQRHVNAVHLHLRPFKCQHPNCNRAFVRRDNLARHVRCSHGENQLTSSAQELGSIHDAMEAGNVPLKSDSRLSIGSGIELLPTGFQTNGGAVEHATEPGYLPEIPRITDDANEIESDSISVASHCSRTSSNFSTASVPFSDLSTASSATSVGDGGQFARLFTIVEDVTTILLGREEIQVILAAASDDPDLGSERLERNVRRMIQSLGKSLRSEASNKAQLEIAKAIRSPWVSASAARKALSLRDQTSKFFAERNVAVRVEQFNDEESDVSIDMSNDEDVEDFPVGSYPDIQDFLLESDSYHSFIAKLLDFAHRPYEKRLSLAVGRVIIGSDGTRLCADAFSSAVENLSWVPSRLFEFSHDRSVSYAQQLKGTIEDQMGEVWDWWPLAPRQHTLLPGYFRLTWTSPCGRMRHIDLPEQLKRSMQDVLSTAPSFLQHPCGKWLCPVNGSTSCDNATTVLPIASGTRSPDASSTAFKPPVQTQAAGASHTVTNRGLNLSTQVSLSNQDDQCLSLCVEAFSRHFVSLDCGALQSDIQLFTRLKEVYNETRGWPLLWFSMWRYDCFEFVRFKKYDYNLGSRLGSGYPEDNDLLYDCSPRIPCPAPPEGPICSDQFRDHYWLNDCPSLFDWKRYHLKYRGQFSKVNKKSLDAVSKRKVRILMDDGVEEIFYGLFAKERRSFFRVAVYAFLCNLPGVIFFFLWLFPLGHGSDLQSASVPVTLSLSMTLGYAAVVFGTREGN